MNFGSIVGEQRKNSIVILDFGPIVGEQRKNLIILFLRAFMALFLYKFGEYMINQKQFNIIKEAFLIYERDFNDYEFTYTYRHRKSNKLLKLRISFTAKNFMHLCGVTYKTRATQFYRALKNNRISLKDVYPKNDGSTNQKLGVISLMHLLTSPGVRICDKGSFYNLQFNKAIRSGKLIIALTCVETPNNYQPQSLLALNTSNQKRQSRAFSHSHEVIKISKVKINSENEPLIIFEK